MHLILGIFFQAARRRRAARVFFLPDSVFVGSFVVKMKRENEFLRWRVVCLCRNVSITAHSLFKNHALPLVFVAQVDILASVSLVVVLWQSSQHIQVREALS